MLNGLPFLFNFGTYMYKVLFILIILVSATQGLASNILDITTITDRNGLSQNTVRCMMQDSQGFMWLGTINGLNRYNGRDFTVIHPQLDGFSRSSDSRISGVFWKIGTVLYGYKLIRIICFVMIHDWRKWLIMLRWIQLRYSLRLKYYRMVIFGYTEKKDVAACGV